MAKKKRIAAKKTVNTSAKNAKKKTSPKKKTTAPKKKAIAGNTGNHRLVINTEDISSILGIHMRSAQRLLQKIKEKLGRRKDEYVSIKEFSKYVHLDEKDVRANLS